MYVLFLRLILISMYGSWVSVLSSLSLCVTNHAGEKHNYNADCDDDEFMVAADFTLYSNPINRALYRPLQAALPATQPLPQLPPPPTPTQTQPASGAAVVVRADSADSQPVIPDCCYR